MVPGFLSDRGLEAGGVGEAHRVLILELALFARGVCLGFGVLEAMAPGGGLRGEEVNMAIFVGQGDFGPLR